MFGSDNVRFCKKCSHYQKKDWSVNSECKLGKETSRCGDTPACNKYEQQFTLFSGNYHCKDCARWDGGTWSGKCIQGYATPKGRDSDSCDKFVKG